MASNDLRIAETELMDTTGSIVKVQLSADPTTSYTIHETILCATPDFFKAAVKAEWTKALPRVIELLDEDPVIFQIYVTWLYNGKVGVMKKDVKDDITKPNWNLLMKSYVLGESLLDTTFKNIVINAMLESLRITGSSTARKGTIPSAQTIKILYEGTPKESKARQLLAEVCADHLSASTFKTSRGSYPHDFLLDMAQVFIDWRFHDGSSEFRHINQPSRYHET